MTREKGVSKEFNLKEIWSLKKGQPLAGIAATLQGNWTPKEGGDADTETQKKWDPVKSKRKSGRIHK